MVADEKQAEISEQDIVLTSSKSNREGGSGAEGDGDPITVDSQLSVVAEVGNHNLSHGKVKEQADGGSVSDGASSPCCSDIDENSEEKLISCNNSNAGDTSCRPGEEEVMQDFHNDVLGWIGNDSSRYIDDADGDKSGIEVNACVTATPTHAAEDMTDKSTDGITMDTTVTDDSNVMPKPDDTPTPESVNTTITKEAVTDTSATEAITETTTENVVDTPTTAEGITSTTSEDMSTTKDITVTTTTECVTDISTTERITDKSSLVDCDNQSEEGTFEVAPSEAVPLVSEDGMNSTEVMNQKDKEEMLALCTSHEMTDYQATKGEEVAGVTVGATHEEIAEKEDFYIGDGIKDESSIAGTDTDKDEFYMAVEGDGTKEESMGTPSSGTPSSGTAGTETDKDEFYMATEGEGFTEESPYAPSTSKEALTEEREDVYTADEICEKKEEMRHKEVDLNMSEKGDEIREASVPVPSTSDADDSGDEDEVVDSQFSHGENIQDVEGGNMKKEGDIDMANGEDQLGNDIRTLNSSQEDVDDKSGQSMKEEGDGCRGDKEKIDMSLEEDAVMEYVGEEHVDKIGEVSKSEEVYEKKEETVEEMSSSETSVETEDVALERDSLKEDVLCKGETEGSMNKESDEKEHTPCCVQEEMGKADAVAEETAVTCLEDGEDGIDEGKEQAVCSPSCGYSQVEKEDEDVAMVMTVMEDGNDAEDAGPPSSSHDDIAAKEEADVSVVQERELGEQTGEGEDVGHGADLARDSSVVNLADELAAAMGTLNEDQTSEMSSDDERLEPNVSSATLELEWDTSEWETSESKKRRLQMNDPDDTQSEVVVLNAQVIELRQANVDIKEKLESCECRLADATVALTVRVESLRDARRRIEYLEKENQAKDEALNEAAERIAELHKEGDDAAGFAAHVDDLQNQLKVATDNLCAAEARIRSLTEELDAQVEMNGSAQAAVRRKDEELQRAMKCKDEELQHAEEKMKMMEVEMKKQADWQQSVNEVVAGLRRDLESRTESTETYAKEMGDAVDKIRTLQGELRQRDGELAEANTAIHSKQKQVDSEVDRNEALKVEMDTEECKALEELIVTAEKLHKAEDAHSSLIGEVSRTTKLLTESEARVTALQGELDTKTDTVNDDIELNAMQEPAVVSEDNGKEYDANFVMKDDLLSDTMLDSGDSFFDTTDSVDEKRVVDDTEVSEVPFQEKMASLVKAQQSRQDVARGQRPDEQQKVNELLEQISQLNNAVRRMVEEKSALEAEITGFRQQAADRQEAHESEVFTLFENYVDLEDKLKGHANQPLATVPTGGASTKKRASMFYHPEQEHDTSLDTSTSTSTREHGKEVASLKSALQQRDNLVMAVKLRAEADRQQLQATVEQLESKVSSQNEAHSVLVTEMESLHTFTWEMLANERETHKSEVEQLRRCLETERLGNSEVSQKLDELNEELRTLVEVKEALEDRLRSLEAEKEQWQAMLRQQQEQHEEERHRSSRDMEQERETSRVELQGSVECRQSQEQLLMQQLQKLQERLSSVTDLNESLVQEHERLKERAARLEAANKEMNIRAVDDGESTDVMKAKCDAMAADIDDLNETVTALRQLSDGLQQEKQVLMAEKECLSEQMEALKVLSDKLNMDMTTLTAEKEDVVKELAEMTTLVDRLQREKEAEAAAMDRFAGQMAELKELSENLQEEKETMSEVNLKMLDDAELMEAQVEELKEQVGQLTQELEQVRRKVADGFEGPSQQLNSSGHLEGPQDEDVQAEVQNGSLTSSDVSSQIVTSETPTGVKRKLDETGFDDDRLVTKSDSAPVETCASCEGRAAELFQLTTKLQYVLDEKNKLQAALDTHQCTASTGSQTEDDTADMDKLKEQLAEVQSRYDALKDELDKTRDELQVNVAKSVESENINAELNRKLETLETALAEKRQMVEQLQISFSTLQEEKCVLEAKSVGSENINTELNRKLETLEVALAEERQTEEQLQISFSTLQEEKCVLEAKSVGSENINTELNRKLETLEVALAEERQTEEQLHISFSMLQEEKSVLEAKSVESENIIAELNRKLETLETALAEERQTVEQLQRSFSTLQEEKCVLEAKSVESENINTELNRKLDTLKVALAEERQTVEQLQVSFSTLQEEKCVLETEAASVQQALADTSATMADLQESMKALETRNESLDKRAAELEAKHAVLEQRRADNEGQLEMSRMSVSELEVRAGVLTAKLQDAEAHNRTLEAKLNDACSELEEAKQCMVSIQDELAVTTARLDEANAAKSQLEQEFETVKVQLEKTTSEKVEVEERLSATAASLVSQTRSREEAENQRSATAIELEDKAREVAELGEKLRRSAESLEELSAEKLEQDVMLESRLTLLKTAEQRVESLEQQLVDSTRVAKEQTAAIEAELRDLVTMQQEAESRTQDMTEQLAAMMRKMERAEADLKVVSEEKAELEERLRATAEELEEMRRSSAKLKDEGGRLEGQLTSVQGQLDAAVADAEAGREEAGALRKETERLQGALDALQVEHQTLERARGEVEQRLKEAEDKCTVKTEEIDRLNADLEEVAKENEKMVQLAADMREVCEERDTLQGKVTLLTSNARRMDRDMKKLQADYDKLCNDKHQVGEQVPQMQDEINNMKKEIESLNDRLKKEVDELNEKLAKKTKDAACHLGRFQSLLKRYNMLEEENDKLKDELEGPVVTPPRASRRLQKVQTKAGAKRAASEVGVDVTSRPKKVLRSQSQREQSVIITEHHDVREDDGKPVKAVDSVATGGSVKQGDLASRSKSLGISSSEEWVTTRNRSRAQSGGLREKSFDDVTRGKQPDLEQRALATISNSPRKVPPTTLPSGGGGKPVAPQPERTMRTRRSLGKRNTAAGKFEAENCKVQ